jgi:hypothetical protein
MTRGYARDDRRIPCREEYLARRRAVEVALNLMHDIVTGAKSVAEARQYYAKEFLDARCEKPHAIHGGAEVHRARTPPIPMSASCPTRTWSAPLRKARRPTAASAPTAASPA